MPNVKSIAPLDRFFAAEQDGLISLREHKLDSDLLIANYTPTMMFKADWDEVTLASRGLIFRKDTGLIVARPFRKFFNAGQGGTEHIDTTGEVEVMDKADGSLGVLYKAPDGRWAVSTRGSMHSEQAEHATVLYRSKYENAWTPDEDYTFLYEIIYPEGRIVLDYNGMDDLILLGAVNKKTGVSVNRTDLEAFGWPGPIVKVYDFPDYGSVCKAEQESNREGFVVRFVDSDERLKIKFDEYLSVHRLIFNLSEMRVYEMLRDGIDFDNWLLQLPDEFTDEAKAWADALRSSHSATTADTKRIYDEISHLLDDRREFAKHLQSLDIPKHYVSLVFGLASGWDDERFAAAVWRTLNPRR